MSRSSGARAVLRALTISGALVATLATAGPASAAFGDGTPAAFSNRPNLKSVTFNGIVASFNFDKPVQPAGGPLVAGQFQVGGYRAGVVVPHAGADTAFVNLNDPTQVLVTYTGSPDFNSTTFGAVEGGAVQGYGTFGTPNLADALRITGATGESGTRGHTAGPDLQSVSVDNAQNRITYTFDQSVASGPPAGAFGFLNADGDVFTGDTVVQVSGANVTVGFNLPKSVQTARQAFVTGGAKSKDGATFAPPAISVDIPARTRVTANPTLVSAELEPNSFTVVYTYDQPIATAAAANFTANASTGASFVGASRTIISPTAVRVTFAPADVSTEHLVSASDIGAAVVGMGGAPSRPAGKPIGANAGAKATGYTTAPDPLSATMNKATGQVTILFDSRISTIDPTDVVLRSDRGDTIPPAPAATGVAEQVNGPTLARLILQYQPSQLALAAAIQIGGNHVTGGAFSTLSGDAAVFGTAPGAVADTQPVRTMIVPTETTQTFSARR